jgi:hypothetical protein
MDTGGFYVAVFRKLKLVIPSCSLFIQHIRINLSPSFRHQPKSFTVASAACGTVDTSKTASTSSTTGEAPAPEAEAPVPVSAEAEVSMADETPAEEEEVAAELPADIAGGVPKKEPVNPRKSLRVK